MKPRGLQYLQPSPLTFQVPGIKREMLGALAVAAIPRVA
jgi:hypothetical protein